MTVEQPARRKYNYSPEARAAAAERMRAMQARKRIAKEQEQPPGE